MSEVKTVVIPAYKRGDKIIPEHVRTYTRKPGRKRRKPHTVDLRTPQAQTSVYASLIEKEKQLREEIAEVRKGIELVNQLKQIAKKVGVR